MSVSITDKEYSNACKEVLAILEHIKEDDVRKIPEEEIENLRKHANVNHEFSYNPMISVKEQNISDLSKAIVANFFMSYIANENQKKLIYNKQKAVNEQTELEKEEKYSSTNIFGNVTDTNIKKDRVSDTVDVKWQNADMIESKNDKWYEKIFNKVKSIISKLKK